MVNFRKWLGREEEEAPAWDLTLDTMRVGFLVDYDLNTWEVIGLNTYDYDGFLTREWQLRCADEVRFLEREEDDGRVAWTLTRRVPLSEVEGDVAGTILDDGEPPETVSYRELTYQAVESSAGVQRGEDEDGAGNGQSGDVEESGGEFVNWSFESEDGRLLYVVQWGERDFAAYEGEYVEEYQFTDILPAAGNG